MKCDTAEVLGDVAGENLGDLVFLRCTGKGRRVDKPASSEQKVPPSKMGKEDKTSHRWHQRPATHTSDRAGVPKPELWTGTLRGLSGTGPHSRRGPAGK